MLIEDFCQKIMGDDYIFNLSEDTIFKLKKIMPNENLYDKDNLLLKIIVFVVCKSINNVLL